MRQLVANIFFALAVGLIMEFFVEMEFGFFGWGDKGYYRASMAYLLVAMVPYCLSVRASERSAWFWFLLFPLTLLLLTDIYRLCIDQSFYPRFVVIHYVMATALLAYVYLHRQARRRTNFRKI